MSKKIFSRGLMISLGRHQKSMELGFASICNKMKVFDWTALNGNKPANYEALKAAIREYGPDIIFAQIQTNNVFPVGFLGPDIVPSGCVRIHWTGDVRTEIPSFYIDHTCDFDIQLFCSRTDVDRFKEITGKPAYFLPISFEDSVFYAPVDKGNIKHDFVFMGRNYGDMFPMSQYRRDMVGFLDSFSMGTGYRAGIYGSNWSNHIEIQDWVTEGEVYRNSHLGISLNHYADHGAYTSDRLFRMTASALPTLVHKSAGIEEFV